MTTTAKQKVREHLATEYGKQMVEIHGLKYVKKEIFHAAKNQDGDSRTMKYHTND